MHPKVNAIIEKETVWKDVLQALRTVILDCGLMEDVKWGAPCYSVDRHNIVVIGALKDAAVVGFFKGVLMADPEGLLEQPGQNTRSARSMRFTSIADVHTRSATLIAYIHEAVAIEKAGLKVDFTNDDLVIPDELQSAFETTAGLEAAFRALTPGRQRAYVLYFADAKQAKTRAARVEKYVAKILDGNGMYD